MLLRFRKESKTPVQSWALFLDGVKTQGSASLRHELPVETTGLPATHKKNLLRAQPMADLVLDPTAQLALGVLEQPH